MTETGSTAPRVVVRRGCYVCSACGADVSPGAKYCPACRVSYDGGPVPATPPSQDRRDNSVRDAALLAAVGWICWLVPPGFLVRDLLRLNSATGKPVEVVIAARRQVILQAIVVVVDFVLAIWIWGVVLHVVKI